MDDRPVRPKVLRVIARLNVGGPARQAVLLHDGLRDRGFDTVLVHGAVGPGEATLEHLLGERPVGVRKLVELGAAIRPLDDIRAFHRLVRLVFGERPDIIHTHTAKAGTLGRLAALAFNATRPRRARCLVVHTYHGNVFDGYFGRAGSTAIRWAERMLARITDRIVVISPLQRADITDRYRVSPADRVSVVRLGLDLRPFFQVGAVTSQLRLRLGFPVDSVVFGSLGRLVPVKNLGLLLHALAVARRRALADLRLVVVGDGVERESLQALVERLDLADAVRFLGWRHDLPAIYEGLDAVALSSRNEGTPVTLIEAMAAGRPVIATAVGGVPDVVTHGQEGLLVSPGDPAAMADGLLRLATSKEDRARLAAAGRSAAMLYGKDRLLDDLSVLYGDALGKRRGRRIDEEPAQSTGTP